MTSTITTSATTTAPTYPQAVWDAFDASTDPLTTAAMRSEEHASDAVDKLAELLQQHPELDTLLRPALTAAIKARAAAESAWVSARDAELAAIVARQAGPSVSVSAILVDGSAVTYAGAVLDVVDPSGTVHLLGPCDQYTVLAPGTFIAVMA